MPHQQRRGAESGHHEKVCTHPGSEQSSQLSIHCQTSSFRRQSATLIHTIPDIIANPAKRCNSFSVKSVKKTAKKLYTFSRNCVILYVPAPGTGFTRAFGRRGCASRKDKRKTLQAFFQGNGDSGSDSEESGCLLVVPLWHFHVHFERSYHLNWQKN